MKKYFIIVFITFSLNCSMFDTFASHLMAGEITWKCVGQDSFLVKIDIYTNCNGITLQNIQIDIKCIATGIPIDTIILSPNIPVDVTPVCNTSCTRCQSAYCSFPFGIRKYTSQLIINLSSAGSCCNILIGSSGDWLSRSSNITTGGANAIFYTMATLNRCLNPCDNSPEYTNPPLTIICNSKDFIYNMGVQDNDTNNSGQLSDSITYTWTEPISAAYTPIQYIGSYAYYRPLYFWGFPNNALPFPRGFHLDANTGTIKFRPTKSETTLISLQVNEFRNGVKIGEIRRDMQVSVINCTNNSPPAVTCNFTKNKLVTCAGNPVSINFSTFDTNSNDTVSLSWNNSIKGAVWTTTNGQTKHPTATFTWTPTASDIGSLPHTFTVFARDNACPINATYCIQYSIKVLPKPVFSYSAIDSGCGKGFFNSVLLKGSDVTYNWMINGKRIRSDSFFNDFPYPGLFSYSFNYYVSEFCADSFYNSVFIDTFLWSTISNDTVICSGMPVNLNVTGHDNSGTIKYLWSTADTTSSVLVHPKNSSYYYVQLSDSGNCPRNDSVFVKVNPLPLISVNNDTAVCKYDSIKLMASGGKYYRWNTGDTTAELKQIAHTSTNFKVFVETEKRCTDTDSVYVTVHSLPTVYAGTDDTICSFNGKKQLFGSPDQSSGSVQWFGQFVYHDTKNNWYFNTEDPTINDWQSFQLTYLFNDSNNCSDTDFKTFTIHKNQKAFAGYNADVCINGNLVNLNGTPAGGLWMGKGIYQSNFYPDSAGPGQHAITYSIFDHCLNADTVLISVHSLPIVTANTINGRNTFCPNEDPVKLVGNPSGGPNGGIWSGDVIHVNYFNPKTNDGKYSAIYKYSDPYGCSGADTLELYVKSPYISIDSAQMNLCYGRTRLFYASFWGADKIFWIRNNNTNGSFLGDITDNPVYYKPGDDEFDAGGFLMKVITTSTICNSVSDSIYIKAGYFPKVDFSGTYTTNKVPFPVSFTNLTNIKKGSILLHQWNFGDGTTSDSNNPVHLYVNAGNYDVRLIETSDIGCTDSLTKVNYISALNGINNNTKHNKLLIFPNPATEYTEITLSVPVNEISSVQIFNSTGKLMRTYSDLKNNQIKILRENLLNGIYLIRVKMYNNTEILDKVVFE